MIQICRKMGKQQPDKQLCRQIIMRTKIQPAVRQCCSPNFGGCYSDATQFPQVNQRSPSGKTIRK